MKIFIVIALQIFILNYCNDSNIKNSPVLKYAKSISCFSLPTGDLELLMKCKVSDLGFENLLRFVKPTQ
jgi:hypothetical protein